MQQLDFMLMAAVKNMNLPNLINLAHLMSSELQSRKLGPKKYIKFNPEHMEVVVENPSGALLRTNKEAFEALQDIFAESEIMCRKIAIQEGFASALQSYVMGPSEDKVVEIEHGDGLIMVEMENGRKSLARGKRKPENAS